jgi:hypothetical protein
MSSTGGSRSRASAPNPTLGLARGGDIFSMNADGTDQRRLTTNPELDRQPDCSPDSTNIVYAIRKPGERINFEVARMTAAGRDHRQLTLIAYTSGVDDAHGDTRIGAGHPRRISRSR